MIDQKNFAFKHGTASNRQKNNQTAAQFAEGAALDIMEIYMYSGKKPEDDVYAVSGGVIDGQVYDHLMEYLRERGVDNAFVQQLQRVATQHEHKQYISLLQDIHTFIK